MGIATEVLFCPRQTCSNALGWHCPWQVPFSLLRSGVLMFTVHALWHSVCVRRLCVFFLFRSFHQYSLVSPPFRQRFCQHVHASLDSLWFWRLAMVGSVCVSTELQLLLSCSVFGNTFLNAGLPWLGRVIVLEFVSVVPCLGLCDGCVCAG